MIVTVIIVQQIFIPLPSWMECNSRPADVELGCETRFGGWNVRGHDVSSGLACAVWFPLALVLLPCSWEHALCSRWSQREKRPMGQT